MSALTRGQLHRPGTPEGPLRHRGRARPDAALQRVALTADALFLCSGGGASLGERLGRVAGVRAVTVTPATGRVVVEFDQDRIGIEELIAALEQEIGAEVGWTLTPWHVEVEGATRT